MAFRKGLDYSKPSSSSVLKSSARDRYQVSFNSSSDDDESDSGAESDVAPTTSQSQIPETSVSKGHTSTTQVKVVPSSTEDSEPDSEDGSNSKRQHTTSSIHKSETESESESDNTELEVKQSQSSETKSDDCNARNTTSKKLGGEKSDDSESEDGTDNVILGRGPQRLISTDSEEEGTASSDGEDSKTPLASTPEQKPTPSWDEYRDRSYRRQSAENKQRKNSDRGSDQDDITNVEYTIKLDAPPIGTASVILDESTSSKSQASISDKAVKSKPADGEDEGAKAEKKALEESRKARLEALRKKRDYRNARLKREDDGRDRPGVVPVHDPEDLPEELSQELYEDMVRVTSQSEMSTTETESICSSRTDRSERRESKVDDESAENKDDSKKADKKKKKKKNVESDNEDDSKSKKKKKKESKDKKKEKKKKRASDDESLATSDTESSRKSKDEAKKKKKKEKKEREASDQLPRLDKSEESSGIATPDSLRVSQRNSDNDERRSLSRSPLIDRKELGRSSGDTEERRESISARMEALRRRSRDEGPTSDLRPEQESEPRKDSVSSRLEALRRRSANEDNANEEKSESEPGKPSVSSRIEALRRQSREDLRAEQPKQESNEAKESASSRLEALRSRSREDTAQQQSKNEEPQHDAEQRMASVSSRLEAIRRRSRDDNTVQSTVLATSKEQEIKSDSRSARLDALRRAREDAKAQEKQNSASRIEALRNRSNDTEKSSYYPSKLKQDEKDKSVETKLEVMRKSKTSTAPRVGAVAKALANIRQGKFVPIEEQQKLDAQEAIGQNDHHQPHHRVKVVVKDSTDRSTTGVVDKERKENRINQKQAHLGSRQEITGEMQFLRNKEEREHAVHEDIRRNSDSPQKEEKIVYSNEPVEHKYTYQEENRKPEAGDHFDDQSTLDNDFYTPTDKTDSLSAAASKTKNMLEQSDHDPPTVYGANKKNITYKQENQFVHENKSNQSHKFDDRCENQYFKRILEPEAEECQETNETFKSEILPKSAFDLEKLMDEALSDIDAPQNLEFDDEFDENLSQSELRLQNRGERIDPDTKPTEPIYIEIEDTEPDPVYTSKYANPVIDNYHLIQASPGEVDARIVEDEYAKKAGQGSFSLIDGFRSKIEQELKFFANREVHYGYGEGTPDMVITN